MRLLLLALCAALGGCANGVAYGPIPHAQYHADSRCSVTAPTPVEVAGPTLFFATSRLPDCRTPIMALMNFRSPVLRFGRFGQPTETKKAKTIPFTFDAEAAWWAALEARTRANEGRVLVYTHGYREEFFSSGRDTFQIARLADFKGPVIAYVWPSQGELLPYAVDETNMYWDGSNFRRFLQRLAEQPWTTEIVLVSHSLGARLVLPAVDYIDAKAAKDSSNISNIILASPDVDREDFERDIVGEVLATKRLKNNRRITVYASIKDRAMALSRGLHGYPRLGSPFCFNPSDPEAVIVGRKDRRCYPQAIGGLTIVDTSAVSRKVTGHSDFINSAAACRDFAAVLKGERAPAGRAATRFPHVFTLQDSTPANDAADREACRIVGR